MRIHWKRVLIAGIWSELLLLVIRFLFVQYAGPAPYVVNFSSHFISLFLGGLWVVRKIESHFVLHGVLVGIVADILLIFLAPLFMLLSEPNSQQLISFLISLPVKILGSAAGAYVGGRWRTKLLSAQAGKSPS